jgi:hypothetical protein
MDALLQEHGNLYFTSLFIIIQTKSICTFSASASTVLYYKKTFIVLDQSHQVRTSLTGRLKVGMNTAEGVEKSNRNRKRGLHHPHGKVRDDQSSGPCKARGDMSGYCTFVRSSSNAVLL